MTILSGRDPEPVVTLGDGREELRGLSLDALFTAAGLRLEMRIAMAA